MKIDNGIHTYERFFPAEPLAAFVKFFYYFHGTGDQSERIVPQSLAEITFNFGTRGVKSFIIPPGHPRGFLQESNQLNAINARSWF